MSPINILKLLCLLGLTTLTGATNFVCPRFCNCDVYLQLNRAQCSGKRLISADVELSKFVQILDLSHNEITAIDNAAFKKYNHLRYLNLSHNAIQNLDLDSFSHLKRLEQLDLSYNRLEYLDDRLFERNRHLVELNLEGNKFMSISNKPLLRSSSLRILSLRNSQLSFIQPTLFDELPNLTEVDVSENLLNTWRVEDFVTLRHLAQLKLSQNVFKCDVEIQKKIADLKAQKLGIQIELNECTATPKILSQGIEKFQKMVMLDQPINESENPINIFKQWRLNFESEEDFDDDNDDDKHFDEDDDDVNSANLANSEWLRFAPDAALCDTEKYKLCHSYRQCLVNLNTAWHEKRSMDSYVSSETKFAFFLGAACGITVVICILTCALCLKNCCESKRKDRLSDVEHSGSGDVNTPALARQQLPPQIRRQPRRRVATSNPPQRAPVVRYEGPVAENFLSRLFGHPARRQYYRTINQNTATLIRRLSRSNLFNNRLSQHFADRQNSTDDNNADTNHYSPSAPRPETPPPCYGDVVVSDCEEGRK
ncbi:uncharacterized protein LOC133333044 [Musca vetustissima]|uniref:uncharacterized protein LOC133333044 n=1 Tax=Musca vetustissima TaxID=27455 RepID=UPI002AB6855D|nr:uncharacterized protein LOC133333044 [Musca vetustissima]